MGESSDLFGFSVNASVPWQKFNIHRLLRLLMNTGIELNDRVLRPNREALTQQLALSMAATRKRSPSSNISDYICCGRLLIVLVVAITCFGGGCTASSMLVETAFDILRANGLEGNLRRIAPRQQPSGEFRSLFPMPISVETLFIYWYLSG